MRVLICDQESEMLETIARTFEVDVATSKATCIDLMRANPFDVLVASERLSDGSGLELLSHVATRWPDTLRVLVIEPARLKIIRGKLGPFKLDATLKYPVDEDELEAVLNRLHERLAAETADEEDDEPEHAPPPVADIAATQAVKVLKVQLPQQVTQSSSAGASSRNTPSQATRAPDSSSAGAARSAPGSRSGTSAGPASGSRSAAPAGSASGAQSATSAGSAQGSRSAPSGGSASGSRAAPSVRSPQGAAKPTGRSAQPLGTPRHDPAPVKRRLGNYTPLGSPEDSQMRIVEREFDHSAAPLASRAIRTREEAARPRTPGEKAKLLAAQLSDRLKRLLKR